MSIKNLEIKASEAKAVEVASLPTRPTSSATYGGRGLTAQQMKEAYDKYPALIKERFNALVADLLSGSALGDIPFDIPSHTPFADGTSATVLGFLGAIGDVIDFGTGATDKTIGDFVNTVINDMAKATSFVYDSSTRKLTLTIDGEEKSVIIEVDKYEQAIAKLNNDVASLETRKYDKAGGGIDGDVTIGGSLYIAQDLTVAGNSTVQEAGHLKIKDAVIVTNKDGEKLAVPSGLAIRKGENAEGTDETYGIMYDPVSDSVKLGLIYQDENGNYLYQAGEGQPVATRADDSEMTENGLAIWDAENRRFVSKDMTDLDLTYGDTTVTYDTTDGISINGQARFTYNGGTTKDVTMDVSIPVVPGDGIVIDKKSGSEQVEVKLDTAFTDGKYVAKCTANKAVYYRGVDGNEGMIPYDDNPTEWSLVQRSTGGVVRTGTPANDSDATPKKYVDDGFVAKQTTNTPGVSYLYGYDSEGVRTFQISGGSGANTVAYRGINGVLKVGTPTASNDATPKAYVDGLHHYTHTIYLTSEAGEICLTIAVKDMPNPATVLDPDSSAVSVYDILASVVTEDQYVMATGVFDRQSIFGIGYSLETEQVRVRYYSSAIKDITTAVLADYTWVVSDIVA